MNPERGDYSSLPGQPVTVDQIVAHNIRYWRRAAGMTQEELGAELGLSGANISDAERSAATGRRRFDAQALVSFAAALGVPVEALFLPPPDDGVSKRYVISTVVGRDSGMADLAALLVADDDSPLIGALLQRNAEVAGKYLDESRGQRLAQLISSTGEREHLLERLSWQRAAVAAVLDDIDKMADAIAEERQ